MANMVEQSAQMIADALAPSPSVPAARWRWGTVVSVGTDGTMTVSIGGATVPGVRCAQHVMGAQVGDRVRVLYCGTECMVDAVRASSRLMELPMVELESTNIAVASPPSSGETAGNARLQLKDKDGVLVAQVFPLVHSSGETGVSIQLERSDGGSSVYHWLRLYLAADGTPRIGFQSDRTRRAWTTALGMKDMQNGEYSGTVGITTAWNGLYYGTVTIPITARSNTSYKVLATAWCSGNLVWCSISSKSTSSFEMFVISPRSFTPSLSIDWMVFG